MTAYITNDNDLGAVADAIRAKTGGSLPILFPGGFVSEIASIPSGGGDPMDEIYTLDGKCRMVIDAVEGEVFYFKGSTSANRGLTIEWGDGSVSYTDPDNIFGGRFEHTYATGGKKVITIYKTDKTKTEIQYLFYPELSRGSCHDYLDGYLPLLGLELSKDAQFGSINCQTLKSLSEACIYYPSTQDANSKALPSFYECEALRIIKVFDETPEDTIVTPGNWISTNDFCEVIELPECIVTITDYTFSGAKGLKTATLAGVTAIRDYAFYNCVRFSKLVIEQSDSVASLESHAFMNTKIGNGNGAIYVPDALLSAYKTATNWSTYASQIKGLSELEGN